MELRMNAANGEMRGKHPVELMYWSLDEAGVLRVTGAGAIPDFDPSGEDKKRLIPWREYRGYIKKVVIEKGIIVVGANAFAGCTELETVVLPQRMKRLAYGAFWGCRKLTEVLVEGNVRFVHIYEPADEEEADGTPVPVIKIGLHAFSETPFAASMWGDFHIKNGVLSDYFGTGEQVRIPDGVSEIGTMAFCGCKVKTVELPKGLQKISAFAFAQTELEKLEIPAGLKTIQYGAFSDIPGNLEITYSAEETPLLEADENAFLDTKIHLAGRRKLPDIYKLELKSEAGLKDYKKLAVKRDKVVIGRTDFNAGESILRRIERGSQVFCIAYEPVERKVLDIRFYVWDKECRLPAECTVVPYLKPAPKGSTIGVWHMIRHTMEREEFLECFRFDRVENREETGLIRNEPPCGKEEWYWSSGLNSEELPEALALLYQWLKKHEGYALKTVEELT